MDFTKIILNGILNEHNKQNLDNYFFCAFDTAQKEEPNINYNRFYDGCLSVVNEWIEYSNMVYQKRKGELYFSLNLIETNNIEHDIKEGETIEQRKTESISFYKDQLENLNPDGIPLLKIKNAPTPGIIPHLQLLNCKQSILKVKKSFVETGIEKNEGYIKNKQEKEKDFNNWLLLKVSWDEVSWQYNTRNNYTNKQDLKAVFWNSYIYIQKKFESYYKEFNIIPLKTLHNLIFEFRQNFPKTGRVEGINYYDDLIEQLIDHYSNESQTNIEPFPPQQQKNKGGRPKAKYKPIESFIKENTTYQSPKEIAIILRTNYSGKNTANLKTMVEALKNLNIWENTGDKEIFLMLQKDFGLKTGCENYRKAIPEQKDIDKEKISIQRKITKT